MKTSMDTTEKTTLKQLRKQAGLTQPQAAASFGVSVDTINRWEKGQTHPTVPQIYKIVAAYRATFDQIDFGVQDGLLGA